MVQRRDQPSFPTITHIHRPPLPNHHTNTPLFITVCCCHPLSITHPHTHLPFAAAIVHFLKEAKLGRELLLPVLPVREEDAAQAAVGVDLYILQKGGGRGGGDRLIVFILLVSKRKKISRAQSLHNTHTDITRFILRIVCLEDKKKVHAVMNTTPPPTPTLNPPPTPTQATTPTDPPHPHPHTGHTHPPTQATPPSTPHLTWTLSTSTKAVP